MITKAQKTNAQTISRLADEFGRLHINATQTVEQVLNLSIPCAQLVVAGVVTGVADTNDGINDNAVADIKATCRRAVEYETAQHGRGWWNDRADQLL